MKLRGPAIGLAIFMAISVVVTWLVYATLQRDVSGKTASYSAMFTDVYGLRESDDVRMAGVRVGRVEKIELQGKLAKVDFIVQTDQKLYHNTLASVTYQNIIGQRYLGLSLDKSGSTELLPPGSVIPLERTEPSFDVGSMLNGFEPLFSVLDPKAANDLTQGVIQSLGGDRASLTELVSQTSTLTDAITGRDDALGTLITSLSKVTDSISAQNDNLDHALTQARTVVADFDARRPALQSSMGSLAQVTRQLSTIMDEVYPSLNQLITRQPGFTKHMVGIEPQLAYMGDNLPLLLKGLARTTQDGTYGNSYACQMNITGFFPGINDMVPEIVRRATNGNVAMYTPKCRGIE